MRRLSIVLMCSVVILSLSSFSFAMEDDNIYHTPRGNTAMMGMAIGHHQAWTLAFPAFFPMMEVRAGYSPMENLQFRIDIGGGACHVSQSEVKSFEGATLLILSAQLGIFWTPRISDSLTLRMGPTIGWWLTSMYGENLIGVTSGSLTDYLEADSQALGGILGLDMDLSERWALSFEARYNSAGISLGGYQTDSGGLTVFMGFVYRTKPWDLKPLD